MGKMKKSLALILALTAVLTITTSTMSASALFKLGDGKFGFGITQGIFNALTGNKDDVATPDTASTTVAGDATTGTTTGTTERKPLINFYIDYDVVKTLKWGFSIGKKTTTTTTTTTTTQPETTTTTAKAEEITNPSVPLASAPTQAPTAQQVVVNETPVPKAAIPSTGDASIAGVAALSLISAAAFVIAKKK